MWKPILGVVLGFLLWSSLWVGGNQLFAAISPNNFEIADSQTPVTSALIVLVMHSLVCSLAAGALARWLSGGNMAPVWVLGGLLLGVGIAVEMAWWTQLPLWYHILFLLLLMPLTLTGAWLVKKPVAGDG